MLFSYIIDYIIGYIIDYIIEVPISNAVFFKFNKHCHLVAII